jgi:hypothetical protein
MASDTKTTGRDSDKFMLRFPDGMRDRIAEAAKANGRSMNAEIIARLQYSFQSAIKPPVEPDSDDWDQVRQLSRERDSLTAKLMTLNTMAMQLEYEIKAAHADDTHGAALDDLQNQSREIRHEMWQTKGRLERLQTALDAAYAKVDGKPPTGEVRIGREE